MACAYRWFAYEKKWWSMAEVEATKKGLDESYSTDVCTRKKNMGNTWKKKPAYVSPETDPVSLSLSPSTRESRPQTGPGGTSTKYLDPRWGPKQAKDLQSDCASNQVASFASESNPSWWSFCPSGGPGTSTEQLRWRAQVQLNDLPRLGGHGNSSLSEGTQVLL
jgi:hypothetical protein